MIPVPSLCFSSWTHTHTHTRARAPFVFYSVGMSKLFHKRAEWPPFVSILNIYLFIHSLLHLLICLFVFSCSCLCGYTFVHPHVW